MYAFITHTWNCIKGNCPHKCIYCYMLLLCKMMLPLRLDRNQFHTNLGAGNFIFVGSSTDAWAEEVPSAWIKEMLDYCNLFDNKYLFQSKNPARFLEFKDHPLMKKAVLCTTIETNRDDQAISEAPKMAERAKAMEMLYNLGFTNYVTVEPCMAFDHDEMIALIKQCHPMQVNIGRNTNREVRLPEPRANEVKALKSDLETFTKVEIKSNAQIWFNH